MSLNHQPSVVTGGLVCYFDMSSTLKSWKGQPTINTCTQAAYNWTDGNATVTRNATPPSTPPVLGYEVAKIVSNNGADTSLDILSISMIDQVNGGVYTHSAYIYLESGTYARVGQHWNPWDGGPAQYIPRGQWTRCSYTVTNATNNYGDIANAYGTDGAIYVTGIQYEAGSVMTPFVGGTRTNAQSIIDIAGSTTFTANNLVFANDAFSFNGSTSYIDCGNPMALQLSTAISISAWVKPTSTSGLGNILSKNYNSGYRFRIDAGAVWWYVSGNAVQTASLCPNSVWSFITVTGDATGLKIYVNGVLSASNTTAYAPTAASAGNVKIGILDINSECFNGTISTIAIHNRALTAAEVTQNFNAHRGRYGI